MSVKKVALIGVLAGLNVSSMVALQFLPNFKPVTAIIIMSTLFFGFKFAWMLTLTTTFIFSLLFGFGSWTFFQILAWTTIISLTKWFSYSISKDRIWFWAYFSFIMGIIYGVVVSFEQFLYTNLQGYIAYWMAGLYFDLSHAVGNFVFYLILAKPFYPIFEKESARV